MKVRTNLNKQQYVELISNGVRKSAKTVEQHLDKLIQLGLVMQEEDVTWSVPSYNTDLLTNVESKHD